MEHDGGAVLVHERRFNIFEQFLSDAGSMPGWANSHAANVAFSAVTDFVGHGSDHIIRTVDSDENRHFLETLAKRVRVEHSVRISGERVNSCDTGRRLQRESAKFLPRVAGPLRKL